MADPPLGAPAFGYLGPFEGKNILVVIDAHSKWIEAVCTPSTSSAAVIEVLATLFAQFGVPETIVTDNGAGFVSSEFEDFLKSNGVKHSTSAPYHPASNGLAERAVQIVKKGLKKQTTGTMSYRLAKILFGYRVSPQTTTGMSPAELLLGRRTRTRLDLLRPHAAERVEEKQQRQKTQHDRKAKPRPFRVGDPVFAKNFGAGKRWLPGRITDVTGPASYRVLLEDGRPKRCHQDQLRSRVVEDGNPDTSVEDSDVSFPPSEPSSSGESTTPRDTVPPESDPSSPTSSTTSRESTDRTVARRYPQRQRRPREIFEPGTN